MAMQLKWRKGWFKGVALQASDVIEAQAQAVADRANGAMPPTPGAYNDNFEAGLDIDRDGWPRGYAVAANTHSQRYEAKHKVLASSL